MNTLNMDPDQDWNGIFDERNSTALKGTGKVIPLQARCGPEGG